VKFGFKTWLPKYTRHFWGRYFGVDNSHMSPFDVPILFMDATYSNSYHVMVRLTMLVSSSGPQYSQKYAETWVAAIATHWLSEACRNMIQSPNSKPSQVRSEDHLPSLPP
jgi:hypothetical protein